MDTTASNSNEVYYTTKSGEKYLLDEYGSIVFKERKDIIPDDTYRRILRSCNDDYPTFRCAICKKSNGGTYTCGKPVCHEQWEEDKKKLEEKWEKEKQARIEEELKKVKVCKCGKDLTGNDIYHKRTMCFEGCSAAPICIKCNKHLRFYDHSKGKCMFCF